MHAGTSNPQNGCSMNVDGEQVILGKCSEEKDLGVIFDEKFIFDKHVIIAIAKENNIQVLIKSKIQGPAFMEFHPSSAKNCVHQNFQLLPWPENNLVQACFLR